MVETITKNFKNIKFEIINVLKITKQSKLKKKNLIKVLTRNQLIILYKPLCLKSIFFNISLKQNKGHKGFKMFFQKITMDLK